MVSDYCLRDLLSEMSAFPPPPPPPHTHTCKCLSSAKAQTRNNFLGHWLKMNHPAKGLKFALSLHKLNPPPHPPTPVHFSRLKDTPSLSLLPSPHPPSAACSSNRLLSVILASCFVSFPHVYFYGHKETRLYSLCYRTNWPNPWTANHLIKISTSLHNTPHDMVSR